MKEKFLIWSERSADTGMKFPLDENADYYQEAHLFFLKTLDEIEIAIKNNVKNI